MHFSTYFLTRDAGGILGFAFTSAIVHDPDILEAVKKASAFG